MSMAIESKANVSSEDDEELDEEPGEAIESAPPLKVGEEREISNSGLKKKLIKRGVGWETPEFGYEVTVHYVGTLLDGTKFESTREGDQPLTFKLGHGEVAKGLAMGIVTMKKGEIALFTVPSDMGYGSAGRDGVPANSIVQFEVELISWITVVDVTKDGGIIKRILEQGNSDRQPSELDEVFVRYQMMRPDGSIVAETPKEGKSFYIKDGHMIPALPKAIKTMKVGEKANLNVQSQYWCNDLDRKANDIFSSIPQTSSLSINLELISLKPVIDVCGDSKVIKKILEEGENLVAADKGAAVTGEAIDTLLAMKGKLTKEEKRHLDDARQDKQVKEHAMQQAQELPPTKSDLLNRTPTPARPARFSGVHPPSGPGGSGSGPSSLPPTKKRRAPLRSSPTPGFSSQLSVEKKGLFFSAQQAGKIAMINEMAQLWGLPPYITLEETPTNLEEAQVRFMEGSALCLSALRSVTTQRASEAELHSLRERVEHYQKELSSLKERTRADGRKIREQDQKMKGMERQFEADKALLESEFHATLLESIDTSFEMGRQAMASLYSEAAQEFDGGKGVFLPDWEVLLLWVSVLEQRKANQHVRQKEKLRQEVLRSRAGARAEAHPSSPTDIPEDRQREKLARSTSRMMR